METYLSEEERLEALQRWWKENRNSVIAGVVFGILVVVGYNMWQRNQLATAQQTSNLYLQMLKADQDNQAESAIKLGERVIEAQPSGAYGDYARLLLAKLKVEANDLPAAKKILEEMLAKSSDEPLRHIARLRLGQVMKAMGEIEPALKALEAITPVGAGKFEGLYEELKGDLYAAANRPKDAREAYERVKELGGGSSLLELKLNDLPAVAGAAPH